MAEILAPVLTGIFSLMSAVVSAWLSHQFSLHRSDHSKWSTVASAVQENAMDVIVDARPSKVLKRSLTQSDSVRHELVKDIHNVALRKTYLIGQSVREKLKDRDRAIICWSSIFVILAVIGTFLGMNTGHAAPHIANVALAPGEPYFALTIWVATFLTIVILFSIWVRVSVGYLTINSVLMCLISASIGGAIGGIVYSLIGGRDTDIGGSFGGLISTLGFLLVFFIVNSKKLKSYGPLPFWAYFVPAHLVEQIFVVE